MANERRDPVADAVSRTDFSAVDMSTPKPLDAEGIPFLTNHEVGAIFSRGLHNSKQIGYEQALPQYKEKKGPDDRTSRTWFSVSHVVDHLSFLSGQGLPAEQKTPAHKFYEPIHQHWNNTLGALRDNLAARKAQGENPGDLTNQPHPANKNIHLRMEFLPHGRLQTVDDPLAPKSLRGTVSGTGSNLSNPRRNGFAIPVQGSGDVDLTLLDPSRGSRIKRRGTE